MCCLIKGINETGDLSEHPSQKQGWIFWDTKSNLEG